MREKLKLLKKPNIISVCPIKKCSLITNNKDLCFMKLNVNNKFPKKENKNI